MRYYYCFHLEKEEVILIPESSVVELKIGKPLGKAYAPVKIFTVDGKKHDLGHNMVLLLDSPSQDHNDGLAVNFKPSKGEKEESVLGSEFVF